MRVLIVTFILMVTIFVCPDANAASIYEKDRNIYFENNGFTQQLTFLERDESPALNPEEEWVYFVRSTEGVWDGERYHPAGGEIIEDGILKEELWRIRIDGTEVEQLFVNDRGAIDGPDPDYVIATINNIQFSPDGDKVYFETPNWVTSAALHIMNPDGSDVKLLGPGNETKIVLSARTFDDREKSYRGYIVTSQHRYFFYGGSYDWFYLFTPDMKNEVAPLGDDFAYFTEMGDIIYTDHSERAIERSEKLRGLGVFKNR